MNVYVAGKMRGVPEFGFPAFDAAAFRLRAAGHTVFSPAERDREHGFDPTGMTGDEDLAALGFNLREALAADTAWICATADAIYMLEGWSGSSGARAEKALAEALGLTVMFSSLRAEWERTPDYDQGYLDGWADALEEQ